MRLNEALLAVRYSIMSYRQHCQSFRSAVMVFLELRSHKVPPSVLLLYRAGHNLSPLSTSFGLCIHDHFSNAIHVRAVMRVPVTAGSFPA